MKTSRRSTNEERPRATRQSLPSPEYGILVATLLAGVAVAALAVGRHLAMFLSTAPGALH